MYLGMFRSGRRVIHAPRGRTPTVQFVLERVVVPLGVHEYALPELGAQVRLGLSMDSVQAAADVLVAPSRAQEVLDDEAVAVAEHGR